MRGPIHPFGVLCILRNEATTKNKFSKKFTFFFEIKNPKLFLNFSLEIFRNLFKRQKMGKEKKKVKFESGFY